MVVMTTPASRQTARCRLRRKRWFCSMKSCKARASPSRWSAQNSIWFMALPRPNHIADARRLASQLCELPQQGLGAFQPVFRRRPVAGDHDLLVGPYTHGAAMGGDELDQLHRIGELVATEGDGAPLGPGIDLLHPSLL